MVDRIENKSLHPRRLIGAYIIKAVVPYELKEQKPGNITKLDKVLAEDKGAVGLVPHFCRTDIPATLGALALGTTELINKPILIPITVHQRQAYLDAICNFAGIDLATVITVGTRKKERKLTEQGKPIPWAGIDPSVALAQYFDRAAETLQAGGVVFFAPQRERQASLERFRGGPVNRLEEELAIRGTRVPAYFPIGLEIPGATDYSKLSGFNIRSHYVVTLGETVRRANIEGNIDSRGYQDMFKLAPEAYRPKEKIIPARR